MKASFYIALFVAFVDFMGVGLIYPLFSSMLFDYTHSLLPLETSHEMRGIWLGILIAVMPFAQFFSAPIWGALSDSKGRKKPLLFSLSVGFLGYAIALMGVIFKNIWLLILSRIVIGFAAGNMSIVQASIADLSNMENKAKNFGLYGMALGLGFTLGPFFGGVLSTWGYSAPFVFAAFLIVLNFLFAFTYFKETHHLLFERKLSWSIGIDHLKKAFRFQGVRTILLCSFLHNFGWSYFFEFAPVYLISEYHFSPAQLGIFYGVAGAFYALSTGLLIRPFVSRFKPETLFFGGNFLAAFAILALLIMPTIHWIWPVTFFICFFVAFVTPSSTTLVSNNATSKIQGEALGVLSSVNAAALVLSPLFSGSVVGAHPTLPMWIGGLIIFMAALIVLGVFRNRLFLR
jgi:DHA1 family tetracycline resistance protein-like MFS transporter